jgi:hypothetical protein
MYQCSHTHPKINIGTFGEFGEIGEIREIGKRIDFFANTRNDNSKL